MGDTVEITLPVSHAAAERLRSGGDAALLGHLLSLAPEGRLGAGAVLRSVAEEGHLPAEERARRFGEALRRIQRAAVEAGIAEVEEEIAAHGRERAARRAAASAG